MSMGAYVHYVRQRFPDGGAGGGGVDVSQTAENGHLQYIFNTRYYNMTRYQIVIKPSSL